MACNAHICWSILRILQRWSYWRLGFSIHVRNLHPLSFCSTPSLSITIFFYQICWLMCSLILLSLSMLILIVQPYKKSHINALDSLLLGLLGALTLLIVTFKFLLPSSRNETLPIIFVIACGFPQLVLLLSVTYRQLKGKRIVGYNIIAGKVSTWLKKIRKQNQAEK